MRIAALDDDPLQLEFLQRAIQSQGHSCHGYLAGAALIEALPTESFDLLIVDWHLPDIDGPDVVRWVRAHVGPRLPILFITHRQQERDIVHGLACGADDFMVKPVRVGELQARLASLLRRAYPIPAPSELVFGAYRFWPETRTLEVHGVPVALRHREYELALFLFQNLGSLLSRDQLREAVWGQVAEINSRSLDTHVSRLRMQLDLCPANGYTISSVYGVGYRFEAVAPDAPAPAGQAAAPQPALP